MSKTIQIEVLNQSGKAVEKLTVNGDVFGAEVNTVLIHSVAVAQANNARQGSKSALTRSEVRGHAKKPYRQKGTGNARQGSTKGPQFDGGGVAFAPKPRDFSSKVNKKERAAAFVSALSGKLIDKELIVITDTKIAAAKTKNVAKIIKGLKVSKVLFVTAELDDDFVKSIANIENADVTTAKQLSVLDIVNYKHIVLSVAAVKAIEEAYK